MSVFNPSLQADVRFDQPVEQPNMFAAVGTALEGLGILQTGTPRQPSDNERFDAAVRQYQSVTGNDRPISEWSTQDFRSFERMAGPRFGQQAVNLSEEMGGAGFVQERQIRDVFTEWRSGASGTVAAANAEAQYPTDPQAAETFVIQQFANEQQATARLEDLQRRAQSGEAIQTLSNDAWETQRSSISNQAMVAANTLASMYDRLADDQTVMLSEVAPDLLGILNGDRRINSRTLPLVAQQVRFAIFSQYTNQLRSLFPGQDIRGASEDFINEVFAPYDDIVSAMTEGVNPTELLRQATDSDMLRVRQQLSEAGLPNALAAFSIAGQLSPQLQQTLLSGVFDRVEPAFRGIIQGQQVSSPEQADDLSGSDRRNFQELVSAELSAVATTPITQLGRAESFVNRLESFIQVQTSSGDRLSPEHYRSIVSDNVMTSIEAAGEDPRAIVSSLIQSDLGLEIGDLQDIVRLRESGLILQGNQLVYVPSTLVSDTGQTLGSRNLSGSEQELLDRINGKLRVVSTIPGIGQELLNAITTDVVVEPQAQSGPGATTPNQEPLPSQSREALVSGVISSLSTTESSGNFMARNNVEGSGGTGHFGRLQFSRGRLDEARAAGVLPEGMTPEQFLRDPEVQQRVENWHINDIVDRINSTGLSQYLGQEIQGVTITLEGMIAAAHLGGFNGMRRFIESGGQYNPADTYGTSLLDYLGRHGEGGTTRVNGNTITLANTDSSIIRRIISGGSSGSNFGGEGSVVLESPSEGRTGATQVEQAPTSTTTPEQPSGGRTEAPSDGRRQSPISQDITDLILALTNRGTSEEEIRAYLEAIANDR